MRSQFDPGFRQLCSSFLLFKRFERNVERFARTMLPSSRKRFIEGGLPGALTSESILRKLSREGAVDGNLHPRLPLLVKDVARRTRWRTKRLLLRK
jgi:hypothetical protein